MWLSFWSAAPAHAATNSRPIALHNGVTTRDATNKVGRQVTEKMWLDKATTYPLQCETPLARDNYVHALEQAAQCKPGCPIGRSNSCTDIAYFRSSIMQEKHSGIRTRQNLVCDPLPWQSSFVSKTYSKRTAQIEEV
ncbi:hypothetical protein F5Y16DRAFT_281596 [Xylariaceae sp. FL0255]|nr:hypothetical protein F5Y16DRAFT_281596 [Xylariaceae sp. FL0255]